MDIDRQTFEFRHDADAVGVFVIGVVELTASSAGEYQPLEPIFLTVVGMDWEIDRNVHVGVGARVIGLHTQTTRKPIGGS